MGTQKIYCENGFGSLTETERLELCRLLIKAGYAVELKRERRGSGNKYIYYIKIGGGEGEKC